MASHRPRRALRPPLALRLARITVPALVAGSLVAGVTVTAWPNSDSLTAVPAASSSAPADDVVRAEPSQVSRNEDRPVTSPSAAAQAAAEAAADRKAAQQKAAAKAKKAAAKKAAKKAAQKRAEKRADARRAKAKEDAEQEAAAKLAHARAKAAAEREKAAAARKLDLDVVGSRYTTADLNVRTAADEDARITTVLKRRSKVSITDTVTDGFRLIVRDGKGRWVKNKYLAKKRPKAASSSSGSSSGGSSGISSKSCNKSSSIEGGLQPDGVRVYRALCARFPNISSFGGRRNANGGFHPSGRAVDAMISNGGWEVARWARANAKRLGVSEVIHAQKIWTVQRSGEGWRGMSDGGNATANHFDHVHISVYGNSGG